ncbi:hypothetical protein CKM354_001274300 [Cercospora kikuchii]|uniref:BTB domain-containing protein n=1 Tax=Cercospora kikuchii TaxID=84275 RepID=A0A9P3FML0_9PEZI|nr:uncharacterized protein CKM354_001274300 [Cercospora kikuchii]GIZ49716.1 hypothetical protein CKM354_001274300 [Cercospora kikuchii]
MNRFRAATSRFLENGKFSDFTIICGTTGREYKVHRTIISAQSRWFDTCCTRDFLEGQQRVTVLKEDDPIALEKMIEYCYKFDYSDTLSTLVPGDCPADIDADGNIVESIHTSSIIKSSIQLHAHVYAIAEKYEVSDLKGFAQTRFREELAANMDSITVIAAGIRAVYQQIELPDSDRALKDLLTIAWIVPGNRRHLQDHAEELRDDFEACPEFLFDTQVLLLQGFSSSKKYPRFFCTECESETVVEDEDAEHVGQNSWLNCVKCDSYSYPHWIEFSPDLKVERCDMKWVAKQGRQGVRDDLKGWTNS